MARLQRNECSMERNACEPHKDMSSTRKHTARLRGVIFTVQCDEVRGAGRQIRHVVADIRRDRRPRRRN